MVIPNPRGFHEPQISKMSPQKWNCEELYFCFKFIFLIESSKKKFTFYRTTVGQNPNGQNLNLFWEQELIAVWLKYIIESVLKTMKTLNLNLSSQSIVIDKGWNCLIFLVTFKSVLISDTHWTVFLIIWQFYICCILQTHCLIDLNIICFGYYFPVDFLFFISF